MSSDTAADGSVNSELAQKHSPVDEKAFDEGKQLEHVVTSSENLVYDDDEEEPELHIRTYFALAAMFLLNLVQVLALQGPPAVVSKDRGEVTSCTRLTFAANSFHT